MLFILPSLISMKSLRPIPCSVLIHSYRFCSKVIEHFLLELISQRMSLSRVGLEMWALAPTYFEEDSYLFVTASFVREISNCEVFPTLTGGLHVFKWIALDRNNGRAQWQQCSWHLQYPGLAWIYWLEGISGVPDTASRWSMASRRPHFNHLPRL